jgi:hypothetical protein
MYITIKKASATCVDTFVKGGILCRKQCRISWHSGGTRYRMTLCWHTIHTWCPCVPSTMYLGYTYCLTSLWPPCCMNMISHPTYIHCIQFNLHVYVYNSSIYSLDITSHLCNALFQYWCKIHVLTGSNLYLYMVTCWVAFRKTSLYLSRVTDKTSTVEQEQSRSQQLHNRLTASSFCRRRHKRMWYNFWSTHHTCTCSIIIRII